MTKIKRPDRLIELKENLIGIGRLRALAPSEGSMLGAIRYIEALEYDVRYLKKNLRGRIYEADFVLTCSDLKAEVPNE